MGGRARGEGVRCCMRHHRRAVLGLFALAAIASTQAACKDPRQEAAKRSAAEMPAHVRQAREGMERITTGFVPVLEGLAPALAAPITANNAGNVRYELIGMNTRQVPAGALTFFPTGFVVAVNRDGVAIARNIAEPDDLMRGMQLAAMFPSVRTALGGTSAAAVGELPPGPDQPSRVYYVAAVPVRGPDGAVVGALAAGISFGQIARSLERAIRTHTGPQPVIWVGLEREGRVLPSGRDRDVPERWLVPQSLVNRIPAGAAARARGGAPVYWEFVEDAQRGWAGALASLPTLEGTNLLLFRSEASQR